MDCFYVDIGCDRGTYDTNTKEMGTSPVLNQKHPQEPSSPVGGKYGQDKNKKQDKDRYYIQVLTDTSVPMADKYISIAEYDLLCVPSRNDYNISNHRHSRSSLKHERKDCLRGTNHERLKDNKSLSNFLGKGNNSKSSFKSGRTNGSNVQDDSNESLSTGWASFSSIELEYSDLKNNREFCDSFTSQWDSFANEDFECSKSNISQDVGDHDENKNMKIADCRCISVSDHNPRRRTNLSRSNSSRRLLNSKESSVTTMNSESNHSHDSNMSDHNNRRKMCLIRVNSSRRLIGSKESGDNKVECDKSASDHHPRRLISKSNSIRQMTINKESYGSTMPSASDHSDAPNIQDYEYGVYYNSNENEKGQKVGRRSSIGDRNRRRRLSQSKSGSSCPTTDASNESNDSTINAKMQRSNSQSSQEWDVPNAVYRRNRPPRTNSNKLFGSTSGELKERDDLKKISTYYANDSFKLPQSSKMISCTDSNETTDDDSKDLPRLRRIRSYCADDVKHYIQEKNTNKTGSCSIRRNASNCLVGLQSAKTSKSITMPLTFGINSTSVNFRASTDCLMKAA